MSNVVDLRPEPFATWERSAPGRKGKDPRDTAPCIECGETFAWIGYGGLCGWCKQGLDAYCVHSCICCRPGDLACCECSRVRMTDPTRAQLEADADQAEAALDYYVEFLGILRPYMEGTGRTVAEALAVMPPDKREEAIFVGDLAGVLRW